MLDTKKKILTACLCVVFVILAAILVNTSAMFFVRRKSREEITSLNRMNDMITKNKIVENNVNGIIENNNL